MEPISFSGYRTRWILRGNVCKHHWQLSILLGNLSAAAEYTAICLLLQIEKLYMFWLGIVTMCTWVGDKKQGTTLIVLHIVASFIRLCGVFVHDIIVHECLSSEEGETSRATQDTADHVFSRLLQPMAYSVLKHLVPHHWTCNQWNHTNCNIKNLFHNNPPHARINSICLIH